MSVKNFIASLWSARMLANLDKKLVYGNCVNKDYEGEIKKQGDRVKVNRMGPVTIKDYTGTLDDPEELNSTQVELVIDQAKYFNFKVDDVDAAQSNVKLIDKGMERASYAMADVIDTYIASFTKKAAIKIGTESTPIEITPAQAYDSLVDLSVALNTKNVPKAGRFAVLPPWYIGMLTKDPRFTKEYKILANGLVEGAQVAGFTLWESNNCVVNANKYHVLAGTEMAISYAGQVAEIEAYRPEKSFADAIKGLWVYGAAVFEANAICDFVVTQSNTQQVSARNNDSDREVMDFLKEIIKEKINSEKSAIQKDATEVEVEKGKKNKN